MSDKLGYECKLYYGTALGAGDTAVDGGYTELTAAKDVSAPLDKAEADMTTRANNGWKSTRGGLKDGSLEFELKWDSDDAGVTFIRQAFMNNTKVLLAIMDGAITTNDNEGFVANFEIMSFPVNQPLEEGVMVALTAKPRDHQEWYVVGA